jgi:lipoprotein-releasing system permease protein
MLTQRDESGRMSRPIVRVAVWGIAIGVAVMILTVGVVNGFQNEIRKKVTGFGSHIQISPFDTNTSFESDSMNRNRESVEAVKSIPGIRNVQPYATKNGIIKSKDQLLGVVVKGVDSSFDWSFFSQNLKSGKILNLGDTVSDRVLVSEHIAAKMNLQLGKKMKMFFLSGEQTRPRVFVIEGIYNTGLTDGFDDRFIICDIRQIQKLNNWDSSTVAGFEVLVEDYSQLLPLTDEVSQTIDFDLSAMNIRDLNPSIFSWLDVLDMNAIIVIVLMLFVSMINMVSALLIMIIDRTNMIGTLKALGAANVTVMRLFLRNASRLILTGLIAGNIAGLAIGFLQKYTGAIGLDETSYYINVVPVEFNLTDILLINGLSLLLCFAALLLPVLLVTRITPVKAIRFS